MTEHQVVVVLDVIAPDRLSAARGVLGFFFGTRGRHVLQDGSLADTVIESWWFPEAELKTVDGNDNAAMHLEHDDSPAGVYVADDAEDEPTVWLHNPAEPDRPMALLTPSNLGRNGQRLLWDHIVRGLPTSAPVPA